MALIIRLPPPSSKLNSTSLLKSRYPTTIAKLNNPFLHFKPSSSSSSSTNPNRKWVLRLFSHRILLSNVVVEEPKGVFGVGRKWNVLNSAALGVVVAMHLLALFAPFAFNWSALWVALGLYVVTGLGITLSYHGNLSHRSFKLPKWLEYLFAYFGVLALQGNPIVWVSTHRYHHQYCDSKKDPHSPLDGFWFSHMNWLFEPTKRNMNWVFDSTSTSQRCGEPSNVVDLEKQAFYRFIKNTYILHPLALGALLYAF